MTGSARERGRRGFSTAPHDLEAYSWLFYHNTREANHAITWSLALGTMISSECSRPEHLWSKNRLKLHLQAMKLYESREGFEEFLVPFPGTDGFAWIDLTNI